MTLIVNHYTHEKTFTVVGEPNGAVKILEDKNFHLNPRIHDESLTSETDGSSADPSSAGTTLSPPKLIAESGGPSDIFEGRK